MAMLDEWHQSFLPSRTGTVRDVILDSAAALLAQIVLFAILRVPELLSEQEPIKNDVQSTR